MPSFNSEKFISKSIESIVSQTYTNWELIITDDFSKDQTVQIVKKFISKDSRIKLIELTKNSGSGYARNQSIKKASGRFISFCDSDDMWKPNKLELQINYMLQNEYVFTYSSYDVISEEGLFFKSIQCLEKINYKKLLKNNYIGCLSVIYDAKSLGKKYMPLIRKRQDWALWLDILKSIKYAHGIKDSLASYRVRKNSISENKILLLKYNWEIYYTTENNSIIKSVFLLIQFIYFYLKKKINLKN